MASPIWTWSPEDDARLIERFDEGATMAQIAKELNRTRLACCGRHHRLRPHRLADVKNKKAVPDGFAEMAMRVSNRTLAHHFKLNIATAARMRKELGIAPYQQPKAPVKFTAKSSRSSYGAHRVYVLDTRDGSLASRAQSHLQRRFSVWRCTPDGTFDPKGSHFRVNGLVRTAEEMIERAKRHGFDPNEWSRLAA